MSLDVMKQALAALEDYEPNEAHKVAVALRAAIEQAQEPVAWYFARGLEKGISFAPDNDATKSWQPLYTASLATTEPVAWMVYTLDGKSVCVTDNPADFTDQHKALPLYTAPRQWQGLTDEDKAGFWRADQMTNEEWEELFSAIEVKLKEKNT